MARNYDPTDALSIFKYSGMLLGHTLAEVIPTIDQTIDLDALEQEGKGGLGVLVEKYFFGYKPNSNPKADFTEAGVELKVSPLKRTQKDELAIKERLVCDMIDYMTIVDEEFEQSRFYKKSMLMLIIFYLHISGYNRRNLEFLYSVLWQIKDKDLLIIRNDFITIRDKIRAGKAHELSEGDTLYLGACRKGHKGQALRKQPYSTVQANARAFSLKTAYMRTILDFVRSKGRDMASNLTDVEIPGIELVTERELRHKTFDEILKDRFAPYIGMNYKQIAKKLRFRINPKQKSKFATIVSNILSRGLSRPEDAEEIKKAGIVVKTIRVTKTGRVKESMQFNNIDYNEFLTADDWIDSEWYNIVTTRYMFVVFRELEEAISNTDDENYVLDHMFFWTMPHADYTAAKEYWENIRENVLSDTLQNDDNTFWSMADHRLFHVRPKGRNAADITFSPISGVAIPKKAYWFNNSYIRSIVEASYGSEWEKKFQSKK